MLSELNILIQEQQIKEQQTGFIRQTRNENCIGF